MNGILEITEMRDTLGAKIFITEKKILDWSRFQQKTRIVNNTKKKEPKSINLKHECNTVVDID